MENETILNKDGQIAYIRVGNTIVDVMHGYLRGDETEPCAVINIYKYNHKKENRLILYHEKAIVLSK